MSQSLSRIYLHIVFSTKGRRQYFQDADLRTELHNYLGGTCRNLECPSLCVGGVDDHVHILCRLSRTFTVAELVRELKRESSKWLKTKSTELLDFHWQDGYGAFSVSHSNVETVRKYIAQQAKHHRSETFQDEFRHLLRLHEIEWDERYVWD